MVLTFLWAVVADAARPATMAALTAARAPEQRKAAIALNRLAVNLGMSIGPAVGGFLAQASFPLLFIVDGMTSLAATALLVGAALGAAPIGRRDRRPAPRSARRERRCSRRRRSCGAIARRSRCSRPRSS